MAPFASCNEMPFAAPWSSAAAPGSQPGGPAGRAGRAQKDAGDNSAPHARQPSGWKAGAQAPRQPPQRQRQQQQQQAAAQGQPRGGDAAQRLSFKPYHSVSVPKSVDLQQVSRCAPCGTQERTTVMLRNIPNRYCQAQLLDEIDSAGFAGTYDFFYLPMDTHNRTNVGYAFINFFMPGHMEAFIKAFSGYRFKDHSSQKIAKVSPAHLQGLLENVQHFSNRAVTHSRNSQYRPVVVLKGQRLDLSDAVEKLFEQQYRYNNAGHVNAAASDAKQHQNHGSAPAAFELDKRAEELVPKFLMCDEQEPPAADSFLPPERHLAPDAPPAPRFLAGVPAVVSRAACTPTAAKALGFSIDRTGLEQVVSQWLQGKAPAAEDTRSTDGGSGTNSCSASQRSSSPAEAKEQIAGACWGLWDLPAVTEQHAFAAGAARGASASRAWAM